MKLWPRRLIYLSFILTFLIIAPILIFYTAGYKFNFKNFKIMKTGVLVLETKPEQADIFINNKIIESKTPAQINNFFPNTYHIKLEKPGYHPWQKNLEIKSNLTTFAKGVILFKQSLPILNIQGQIDNLLYLEKNDKLLYKTSMMDSASINIKEMDSLEEKLVYSLDKNKTLSWSEILISNNQNKILLPIYQNGTLKYIIYNLNISELTFLSELTNIDFELVRWADTDENIIYGYKAGILYHIDLTSSSTKRLLAAQIKDFLIRDLQLYYISPDNLITKISLAEQDLKESIKLPSNSSYSFDQTSLDYLTLVDQGNQEIMILDDQIFADSQNLIDHIILQASGHNIVWTNESSNVLYYNDFELWVYNFDTQQSSLLTRLGEGINKSYWYTDNKYIVYQTYNKLRIIELDSRDRRNDIVVTEINEITDSFLSGDGEKIYLSGKLGNQQGIFELQIR